MVGFPCTPISTVEVTEGDGIDVSLLASVYTVSLDATTQAILRTNSVYVNTAARDADNPSPTSGDVAYAQDIDTRWSHDGTGWIIMSEPQQPYSPTSANITVASGTLVGSYKRGDGYCDFTCVFTLGAGSTVGTSPALGLPVACAATPAGMLRAWLTDTGTNNIPGVVGALTAGATSATITYANATGTPVVAAGITATVPFTWASTDILVFGGRFQMNTKYL